MWFVFSDTGVDFPGKVHKKTLLVRPLCLGRNCDKYLQNDPLDDPSEFLSSCFQVSEPDNVNFGCRLQDAVCSKYFLVANATDLTVYFPRYISSKVMWYECATLREIGLVIGSLLGRSRHPDDSTNLMKKWQTWLAGSPGDFPIMMFGGRYWFSCNWA